MTKHYKTIIVLVLAVALAAACTATPQPTSPPTTQATEPTATTAAPTDAPTITTVPPASTDEPTVNPPTPTETPAEQIESDDDNVNITEVNTMNIQIGDTVLTATLAENSSVDALKEALADGPISIDMRDYANMEKVGSFGMELPRNDQQITTEAGDLILYQGSAFVIYYAPNSWNFTRLGKINDVTAKELKDILGDGNVTVTLSLP